MVAPTLIGRIGNQIFQICGAIGYARKHRMDYCVPEKSLDPNVWKTYFNFPTVEFEPSKVYKERMHCYHTIPYYKDVRLEGYFQSEKYFTHCKDEILQTFNFPNTTIKGTVSLHVRRGDYLLHSHLFPVLPEAYHAAAIKYFTDRGYTKFLVFSDDIQWCKENINSEKYNAEFEYSEELAEVDDMKLMSRCEHNIISNSSFSWWGAFMNKNPDKIVVAPSRHKWFGRMNAHLKTQDIIPEKWIQIKW